jgi:hypothetical protein
MADFAEVLGSALTLSVRDRAALAVANRQSPLPRPHPHHRTRTPVSEPPPDARRPPDSPLWRVTRNHGPFHEIREIRTLEFALTGLPIWLGGSRQTLVRKLRKPIRLTVDLGGP